MWEFALITRRTFLNLYSDGVRAVIFDMDGVLINAREWHYEALNEALGIFGEFIKRDEHLDRFDGLATKTKLAMLTAEGRIPRHLHSLINDVRQERTMRLAALENKPNLHHLILLGQLKAQGIKLGVATNSIRMTTELMLRNAGILGLMDCVSTNEDVQLPKPSPEIYLRTAKLLMVPPEQCIVVEDSPTGVESASGAGMKVIHVNDPSEVNLALFLSESGDR